MEGRWEDGRKEGNKEWGRQEEKNRSDRLK